jgi:predicted ribosomally synthesized peptide with nif11-like leader
MSLEQAKALIDALKTDRAFFNSITAIDNPSERLQAIIDAGFSCTIDEIRLISAEIALQDDVSAGSTANIFPCPPVL